MASEAYTTLLNQLNRDVAQAGPDDVLQYCADWFAQKLRDERSTARGNATPSSSTRPAPAFNLGNLSAFNPDQAQAALSPFSELAPSDSPFGGPRRNTFAAPAASTSLFSASPFGMGGNINPFGGATTSAPAQEAAPDEPVIPSYALGRRTSVSAESLKPQAKSGLGNLSSTAEEDDETTPNPSSTETPVFPKSEDQLNRIRAAISQNFLFRNLDEEQSADILAAMKEVSVAPGEMVIEQGAAGDFFYVVEEGKLDIFVKKDGQILEAEKGDREDLGKKVHTTTAGGSFGELALMYNAPRAASIVSVTPATLWALDRISFRTILLDHTSRKRRMYETFLSTVPILASLEGYERAKIADALESRTFNVGENVITEGEVGEDFFLVESGTAEAVKGGNVVLNYKKGDYFGELALLNRQNRAATVRASGEPGSKLRVAALGEQAFTRLLGPVKDIMARSAGEQYGLATR